MQLSLPTSLNDGKEIDLLPVSYGGLLVILFVRIDVLQNSYWLAIFVKAKK